MSFEESAAIVDEMRGKFVECGNALAEIRDKRLYRGTHDTFEAYCYDVWKLTPGLVSLLGELW